MSQATSAPADPRRRLRCEGRGRGSFSHYAGLGRWNMGLCLKRCREHCDGTNQGQKGQLPGYFLLLLDTKAAPCRAGSRRGAGPCSVGVSARLLYTLVSLFLLAIDAGLVRRWDPSSPRPGEVSATTSRTRLGCSNQTSRSRTLSASRRYLSTVE